MLEIKVPTVGESISEVTVSRWLKNDGDFVEMDEVICELESDKATFELNATASGLLKRMALEGDTIPVGSVICGIDTDAKGLEKAESKEGGKVEVKKAEAPKNDTVPSPQAKKEETKKTTTGSKNNDLQFAQPVTFNDPSLKFRGVRVERMSSLRKTIARRLVAVKNDTAMLTTFNEVDMKPVMELRAKYKDMFKEKHGVGLGFMSFFTKAVCEALHDFPSVGAQIEGENLVYYDYADISIAVSTEKGLVVPVIRNAEKMSMAEIEKEILNLATKARENKLTLEEMTGGTFTITNGGVFGSMLSTPIINAPQSAILGMHNIVERPVVVNKEIVIRPIMYVALSYDHRIIDGKESVGFLVKVKQVLENPERLLLEV